MELLTWVGAIALILSLGVNVLCYSAWRGLLGLVSDLSSEVRESERQRLQGNRSYYCVLRRELAHIIIQRDAVRYSECAESIRDWVAEIRVGNDSKIAERKLLETRYPQIDDFDIISLKHFVPYENFDGSTDELCARFVDICKMIILTSYSGEELEEFSDNDRARFLDRYLPLHSPSSVS